MNQAPDDEGTCDAPSGYHDDGDPMLCTLAENHDGYHDHSGMFRWARGTLAVDCEDPPEITPLFHAIGDSLRDFGYPTVTDEEVAVYARRRHFGVEPDEPDVIALFVGRLLDESEAAEREENCDD